MWHRFTYWLATQLDGLYHKTGHQTYLRWACDWYESMHYPDGQAFDWENAEVMEPVDEYAYRCGLCQGLEYPGLTHNPHSPECEYYDG